MRRLLFISCLLLVSAMVFGAPSIGYEVSACGYSEPQFSEKECGKLSLIYALPNMPVSLHAGTSIPLGGAFPDELVLSLEGEWYPVTIREHLFTDWMSVKGYYQPSVRLGAETEFSSLMDPALSLEIHPLRFAVGGGYISILAPDVFLRPFDSEPSLVSGWGLQLYSVGFYLW